ncbi:MAG: PAS domain S-box protein [Bryobacteraceae bacterium]
MKRVEALIWEARGHASDLRSATDPGKRKRIEEKWRAAVSLAEANLNLFSARLRARPGATIEATRSVHARDLALGALGIVSLLGALLWRFALSPQADKRSATLPRAAGSDFSLVAYRLSRDAIIAADHAGNVCAMNSSAEKMLGAPATCFIGKPLAKIVPAPDGELLEPRAVVATHHSGASIPVEMIYRRLRGRSRRASMAILRPRTSQALVPAAAPPAPAPTTAARLQADSTLLADLLSHCPAPLVVFDTSGRMLHFNRACFEATGYSVADVRDEPYWKVALGGEDAEMERRSWEAGVPLRHSRSVLQNWRTARGPVWFEWSWSVFRDGDGKPMFVVAIGAEVSPRARPVRAAIEAAVA